MLLLLQPALFAMCWGTRSPRLQLTSRGILGLAASRGKTRECHVAVENSEPAKMSPAMLSVSHVLEI